MATKCGRLGGKIYMVYIFFRTKENIQLCVKFSKVAGFAATVRVKMCP